MYPTPSVVFTLLSHLQTITLLLAERTDANIHPQSMAAVQHTVHVMPSVD